MSAAECNSLETVLSPLGPGNSNPFAGEMCPLLANLKHTALTQPSFRSVPLLRGQLNYDKLCVHISHTHMHCTFWDLLLGYCERGEVDRQMQFVKFVKDWCIVKTAFFSRYEGKKNPV